MESNRRAVFLRLRRWCLVMACLACVIKAFFRFVLDGGSPPTKTVTLAVGREIVTILDLYSPLLSATSPLLGPRCAAGESCDVVHPRLVSRPPDAPAYLYPGADEAEGEGEGWVFALLRREVWVVCTMQSQCDLGPAVSLSEKCRGLTRALWRAEEKHYEIADSLAGPHRDGLWVNKIAFSFIDFLSRLEAAATSPQFTLDHDHGGNVLTRPHPGPAAAGEPVMSSARALRLLVAHQGPWQSLNGAIRDDLLSLRGDCVQIVEDLELLSQACGAHGGAGYPTAFSVAMGRASEFIPHIRRIVSAIDDNIAALDAVEGGMMALRTILGIMTDAGWGYTEHIDGQDWTVLFRLPPPWDISRAVGGRLEMMGADAPGMHEKDASGAPSRAVALLG